MPTTNSDYHPNAYYDSIGLGTRDSASSGVDIAFEPGGDLIISQGQLDTETGANHIISALLRRLYTPEYGYRRFVRGATGLEELDADYGDKVFNYLSSPITPTILQLIRDAVYSAASADGRIIIKDLSLYVTANIGKVGIDMMYQIKGSADLKQLQYVLQPTLPNV